jgi:hypothetical protein
MADYKPPYYMHPLEYHPRDTNRCRGWSPACAPSRTAHVTLPVLGRSKASRSQGRSIAELADSGRPPRHHRRDHGDGCPEKRQNRGTPNGLSFGRWPSFWTARLCRKRSISQIRSRRRLGAVMGFACKNVGFFADPHPTRRPSFQPFYRARHAYQRSDCHRGRRSIESPRYGLRKRLNPYSIRVIVVLYSAERSC